MSDPQKLPVWNKAGDVHVVVETPRGSAAKFEFDRASSLVNSGAVGRQDWESYKEAYQVAQAKVEEARDVLATERFADDVRERCT